ncbi:Glycoprotein 3-alpha-L-fucosyltransferase A [Diplonema papillatum]|nr:Glycoprotein 3-alpha-L-fucosyltransferase A [Diplonema papillatum]
MQNRRLKVALATAVLSVVVVNVALIPLWDGEHVPHETEGGKNATQQSEGHPARSDVAGGSKHTERQTEAKPTTVDVSPASDVLGRDVVIAELKNAYICSYMAKAERITGKSGCQVKCPAAGLPADRWCQVYTNPSKDDIARADAVVYHPGRKVPVSQAHPKQWSVMWYGESQEKHPEMYTDTYLSQYNAHVVYKKWSKYHFSWTQRFEQEFTNFAKTRKQWVPWEQRRTAVAVVSNCKYHTTNRSAVMAELDRLLQMKTQGREQLFMFGGCHPGREKDIIKREHPSCKVKSEKERYKEKMCILRQYKFVVSIDNSRDEGYVTEKVYHALISGAVPLYAGAPDIEDFVPLPNSVLKIEPSASLGPIVDYMLKASSPPPETEWWEKSWSKEFLASLHGENPACRICSDIYRGVLPPKFDSYALSP